MKRFLFGVVVFISFAFVSETKAGILCGRSGCILSQMRQNSGAWYPGKVLRGRRG